MLRGRPLGTDEEVALLERVCSALRERGDSLESRIRNAQDTSRIIEQGVAHLGVVRGNATPWDAYHAFLRLVAERGWSEYLDEAEGTRLWSRTISLLNT